MTAKPYVIRRSAAELAADVIAAIMAGPAVCQSEINRRVGLPIHKDYARKYVRFPHDKGLIYVAEWKGCNSPRYAWAGAEPKEDAARPRKKEGPALRIHTNALQRRRRIRHRGYVEGSLNLEAAHAVQA